MPKEFPYSFMVAERAQVVQDSHVDLGTRTSPSSLKANQAFGRSTGKAAGPRRTSQRKPSSRRLKLSVLVVDDVPDVTEMISLFLKHAGYDVATADSAAIALQLANETTFNLVISDIGMPEMNGYELAESLRRRAEYRGIPIIAVTGYSEYDDRTRALQSGFNAHLTKPIDPTELLNLINELLS
jgi:two-component system, chemotaxis family, CheB/CheR fusion protein